MNSINPITPRTETVIVLQGDDDERLRELKAEVDRLAPKKGIVVAPLTLDETDDYEAAKRAHDEFAAEAKERGVKVILRAVGRKTWRDLIAKHPVRVAGDGVTEEQIEADKNFGANVDALQEELVPMCMASPAGTNEERSAFLDSLNEGQFGDLAIRAWGLNIGKTADPTQRLSSEDSRNSVAISS